MEQHLPEPLAVCLEDGLAHDDATLVDQDGARLLLCNILENLTSQGIAWPISFEIETDKCSMN